MEIAEGLCNFCKADRVLYGIKIQNFQTLIESLFKQYINTKLFEDFFGSFKLCPFCHEKCVLLDKQFEVIKTHRKRRDKSDNCVLCGNEDIYKIKNWPHFDKLSEDFDFESKTVLICPACLIFMDHRNTVKQQLLQHSYKSNHSPAKTPRAQVTQEAFGLYLPKKDQNASPNMKKEIKTLKQQNKVLNKTLISDYKLYNSILYVRLTDFSSKNSNPSSGKIDDTLQHSETHLESPKPGDKNLTFTDSSRKNIEFQIVSCSNTRNSAFKIKLKSLKNTTNSLIVSKQSKSNSVSETRKSSSSQNNKAFELSPKAIRQRLKENHISKELLVEVLKEDLEKKQKFSLPNNDTIIIYESDDNEPQDLVKDIIDRISYTTDPLDIPEIHSDVHTRKDKEADGKRTRNSRMLSNTSTLNEDRNDVKNETDKEAAVDAKTKQLRKAKIASKSMKTIRDEEQSDDENEKFKSRRKQKTPSKRTHFDRDENKQQMEEGINNAEENDNQTTSKPESKKPKIQITEDKNVSDNEENNSSNENDEEESKIDVDCNDADRIKIRKPRNRAIPSESDDESNIEIEDKPGPNQDEPENRPESDADQSEKVQNIQKQNTQLKEKEFESTEHSKELKIIDETNYISQDTSNRKDQNKFERDNDESIVQTIEDNEQSTFKVTDQEDKNPMEESSIENYKDSGEAENSAGKDDTQIEESGNHNKHENEEHDPENKETDYEKGVTNEDESKNDMICDLGQFKESDQQIDQNNEVEQNDEITTSLNGMVQEKEYEEQCIEENEENRLEEIDNEVADVEVPRCENEVNNECVEGENIDNGESKSEEDIQKCRQENINGEEENNKKRKSNVEITNESKKLRIHDVEEETSIEDEYNNVGNESIGSSNPTVMKKLILSIQLSDTEDSQANDEYEKEDENSNENFEHDGQNKCDSSSKIFIGNNVNIDSQDDVLNYEYSAEGEERLDVCEDDEKFEKKKKKVTFSEESNVTIE